LFSFYVFFSSVFKLLKFLLTFKVLAGAHQICVSLQLKAMEEFWQPKNGRTSPKTTYWNVKFYEVDSSCSCCDALNTRKLVG
jgi:hypothetical protein